MPAGSEQEVLSAVGRLKKAGLAEIAQDLEISNAYAGQLCRYLARKRYLVSLGGGRYSLAPKGLKSIAGDEWKLTVDKAIVAEIAKGLAKEVAAEVVKKVGKGKEKVIIKERDLMPGEEEKREPVKIKTSFIMPSIDLEEIEKMESNIEKVSKAEKRKFDIGGAVEALKKSRKKR